MPLNYAIVEETAQVRVTGSGGVSMSGMIGIIEQVAADPRFRSCYTVIMDLRTARYTAELADGDILAAVLTQKKNDFQNKFAVVVPESLHFLARLYCVLTTVSGFDKIQCFTSMDEAQNWCQSR